VSTLGVLGFGISMVTLIWNFALTWVRVPRIAVEIHPARDVYVGGGETSSPESFRLVVVNRGADPITIKNVGLKSPQTPELPLDYETDLRCRQRVPEPEDQSLPARIEGRGVLIWTYDEELLSRYPIGTSVNGYADRYKAIHWPCRRSTARAESAPVERGGNWD
jgi:hypothetical protein